MRNASSMFRPAAHRRGMTLFEIMIASAIAAMMAGGGVYITIFTLRAFRVLNTQMRSQVAATQAIQNASNRLRNARFASVEVRNADEQILEPNTPGASIRFQTLDSATSESLRFEDASLLYIPDTNKEEEFRIVRNLERVDFIRLDNNMVQIEAQFLYPRFRGFGNADANLLNGTFTSRVFARN